MEKTKQTPVGLVKITSDTEVFPYHNAIVSLLEREEKEWDASLTYYGAGLEKGSSFIANEIARMKGNCETTVVEIDKYDINQKYPSEPTRLVQDARFHTPDTSVVVIDIFDDEKVPRWVLTSFLSRCVRKADLVFINTIRLYDTKIAVDYIKGKRAELCNVDYNVVICFK